jgi:hypothetical protein
MYFNDGKGINMEVLIESQIIIISFPDALCCIHEDKQP